jgi:hypothetical protein
LRPRIIIFNFIRIIEQVKNKKMELSKKDRKVARQIIEDGLQNEFGKGLDKIDKVLKKWKEEKQDNRESYHLLFETISDFDKHIAKRYDNMTGSKYLFIIASQLHDDIINEGSLSELSEEVIRKIKFLIS